MVLLNIGDLPPEFTSNPLAYVAILGLDIINNSIHRAIWESFTANRTDRAPLFLKLIAEDYAFPKAKQKRNSYDWYVPKGILKTNWLTKHLTEIPSVAVQFVDLDWDSPVWTEKRAECASKLENLRASLQGRSTRVALVLIQKRAALPGTDDQIAAERAASLCSACDLSGKTLFVLPHSDHLYGYTLRLQNAFYELAQTYYNHESRRIRNHREHLNKTTHQLLFVRHQFKMAFLSELKQDINTALKSYKQAYANLMEVKASEANMLEVKTVAGFINYKMCRLLFLNAAPVDAIAQFRKHVDIFKNKVGPTDLAFEHSAWISKQFSHFGDLFEDAVLQGLNAIQTQHPGFYYQQAANHAVTRKQLCFKLCKSVQECDPDILVGAENLEFYGQRPWRPCCQSLEPPDPQKEHEGIEALKYQEFHEVNHSMIVIPLLSSAVTQFKKYKCPRMKRQLTVEMGEEYYFCKDYSKALTLLRHVLWDYRIEKWRPIVSSILLTAVKCAYLSANLQEYVSLGLEAISYWLLCSTEEKSIIQSNINNLFQGKQPLAINGIPEEESKEAEKLWVESIPSRTRPVIFTVQMASIIPFIECKAGFASADYVVDQRVTVTIYLRMNCLQPMTFSKLTVLYNNPYYNKFSEVPSINKESGIDQNGSACQIYLVPRNTHTYNFSFIPDPNDIGKHIEITSVALQLGSEESLCAILHWSGTGSESLSSPMSFGQFATKAFSFSDDPSFQHIVSPPSTKIFPRNAKVKVAIHHEPPALIDEFFIFSLDITNEELSNIDNVSISVAMKEGQEQFVHESTHLCETPKSSDVFCQYLPSIALRSMSPGETVRKKIFMKATQVASRKLVFEVMYDIDIEVDEQHLHCSCKKSQDLEVKVEKPFLFSFNILNMKFEEQLVVRTEEPFLLKVDIFSASKIPVYLEDASLELNHGIKTVDETITSDIQNLSLMHKEAGSECFCLEAPLNCPSNIPIGVYRLKWKRKSEDNNNATVETAVTMSTIEVTRPPIYLELEHPAHGWVRTPMTVTYYLHNRLSKIQDVELLVDSSDAFMYAGNKQMHFRIMPRDKYKLMYNLYPLVPGYVPLPRLRMTLNAGSAHEFSVDDLIRKMVPSHIFVMPQGKSNADDTVRST